MKKEEYIESGYEDQLKKVLKSDYHSILINGNFGTGKTTMLSYVFNLDEFNDEKVLNLKAYEEYVETNYIDYLYNKLIFENLKEMGTWKRFYHNYSNLIMITIIDIIIFLFTTWLTNALTDGVPTTIYLMIIVLFVFGVVNIFKTQIGNLDKLEKISELVKKYDYVVIDDLERIFWDYKEILKMIQYLNENISEVKIILLADKEKFQEKEIDILEKYYDLSFEIPSSLIVQNKVLEFIEKLEEYPGQEADESNMRKIKEILFQLNIRNVNKIITHYNSDMQNNKEIVSRLVRSDYLFMLIQYYTLNNYNNFTHLLYDIKKECSELFISDDEKQEKLDDAVKKINTLDISNLEKKYLIESLAYSKEKKVFKEKIMNNSNKGRRLLQNRLFDFPIEYKINSFYLNVPNFREVQENFLIWLEKEHEKINYHTFDMYKHINGQKAVEECSEYINENYIEGKKFYSLIKNDVTDEIISDKANIKYLKSIEDMRGYDDGYTYEENKDIFEELWNKLDNRAKLEILEIEAFTGRKYFLEKYILNDADMIETIIDEMINSNRPYRFKEFFIDTGNIEKIDKEDVESIINLLDQYANNLEKNLSKEIASEEVKRKKQIKEVREECNELKNLIA